MHSPLLTPLAIIKFCTKYGLVIWARGHRDIKGLFGELRLWWLALIGHASGSLWWSYKGFRIERWRVRERILGMSSGPENLLFVILFKSWHTTYLFIIAWRGREGKYAINSDDCSGVNSWMVLGKRLLMLSALSCKSAISQTWLRLVSPLSY